jgi:hypothetical protein
LKALKRIRVSRRNPTVKEKRKSRARELNSRFSVRSVKNIVFTDEKDFTLEVARNRLYPNSDYVFQQDGAPSHTSRLTQGHLAESTPDFINKDSWPPQSPDLNPLDYFVWNALSEKVYANRHTPFTMPELKEAIVAKWEEIPLRHIRKAILQWKPRLQAVVKEDGGHIEHLF